MSVAAAERINAHTKVATMPSAKKGVDAIFFSFGGGEKEKDRLGGCGVAAATALWVTLSVLYSVVDITVSAAA